MVKIIGISGKKQSGKNTAANYIHGIILKSKDMIEDFEINQQGQLIIKTTIEGDEEYGVLDITRKDNNFVEYAHHNLWPYVKLYSFADGLKNLCMQFFGLSFAQTYGTDEEKNTLSSVEWENIPTWQNSSLNTNRGLMTSRELLQYFGTDIMRQMHTNVWVDHAINTIEAEQSKLAILADVRFPNEVEAVQKAGGKVIRLTRESESDVHSSECALDEDRYDWKNFDFIVDNTEGLESLFSQIENISNKLEFTC